MNKQKLNYSMVYLLLRLVIDLTSGSLEYLFRLLYLDSNCFASVRASGFVSHSKMKSLLESSDIFWACISGSDGFLRKWL